MTGSPVTVTVEDGVAVVTVDWPPVNALSAAVRGGVLDAVTTAGADPGVWAVVLICAGRTFIAGADIAEFGKPPVAPVLARVMAAVEACPKPVVAAIHGSALGGGLELALACHGRIAVASAKLGLPEVKLGLIPGAGGTQALPRLIGVEAALAMITGGEPVPAGRALALGLIDRLADEGRLREDATAFARSLTDASPRRIRDLAAPRADPETFARAKAAAAKSQRGRAAPLAAIEAVAASTTLGFDEGLALERRLFETLRDGEQSAALRYLFFAERLAGKIADLADDTPSPAVERIGVVGAGTMGAGIALAFAAAGLPVTVLEARPEALERGLKGLSATLERAVASGRLSADDAAKRRALITGTLDIADLAPADLVVEAVFEDMAVKIAVLADLAAVVRAEAILATNTSYLDVDAIAAATPHPERVLGLHFFSPAQVMKLVEVVRGARTSAPVLAAAMRLARRIGKIGVVAGVAHGFIGNRMQAARQRQANLLILEGAAPADVDRVLYDFGMPMGPFAMLDMAGLDIGWHEGKTAATVRDRLCEAGRRGIKSGAGFYDYVPDRRPVSSPLVDQITVSFAAEQGVTRRAVGDDEILDRCLMAMVNEGAKILDEGMAQRASDIDVVWVHGYGWPAWRGGPMHWADGQGLDRVLATMTALNARHGPAFGPAPLLVRLAAAGGRFTA